MKDNRTAPMNKIESAGHNGKTTNDDDFENIENELFSFLENFDLNMLIRISDTEGNVLFDGKIGDIPFDVICGRTIVKGSANQSGLYMLVKVSSI